MADTEANTPNECIVCCQNIEIYAVGVCNHPVVSRIFIDKFLKNIKLLVELNVFNFFLAVL